MPNIYLSSQQFGMLSTEILSCNVKWMMVTSTDHRSLAMRCFTETVLDY